MKYTPVQPPEGINTSKEHPLKEFVLLTGGVAAIVMLAVAILALLADHLVSYIPIEYEQELFANSSNGHEAHADDKTKSEGGAKPDAEAQVERYLNNLVKKLQRSAGEEYAGYRFSVNLLGSESPNAFVFPGGHIGVTRGLFKAVKTENGLAMVLSHEMAHQFQRHPLKSLGRGVVIGLALIVFTGAEGSELSNMVVGNVATLGQLAFSREQERVADRLGVELLKKHYGHANGATEFFEYIDNNKEIDFNGPSFLSTHPSHEERIAMLGAVAAAGGDKTKLPPIINKYLKLETQNHE